ncbi:MAG: thioredoxin family protein [Muribaculaceae bacterium]|nr:thioredoxin family protein [Muribaculaceae bacterium]
MNYTQLISSSPVVLVEFFATWCPHCKKMMPIVEQIKELLEGSVEIYQLDIDQNDEAAEEVEVTSVPTFILYKDGKEMWRQSGEMEAQVLLSKIQSVL